MSSNVTSGNPTDMLESVFRYSNSITTAQTSGLASHLRLEYSVVSQWFAARKEQEGHETTNKLQVVNTEIVRSFNAGSNAIPRENVSWMHEFRRGRVKPPRRKTRKGTYFTKLGPSVLIRKHNPRATPNKMSIGYLLNYEAV